MSIRNLVMGLSFGLLVIGMGISMSSCASGTSNHSEAGILVPALEPDPNSVGTLATNLPFSTNQFYVDANSPAGLWVKANTQDSRANAIKNNIANVPVAKWFGNWNSDVKTDVSNHVSAAARSSALPVLVAYNIPGRDCGNFSAGGAANDDAYKKWITNFAEGIGSNPAIVVFEPDALPLLTNCPQGDRIGLFTYAEYQFSHKASKTYVYLDAGNAKWHTPEEAAKRLSNASVQNTRGFSLNVDVYETTAKTKIYGDKIVKILNDTYRTPNMHYIIDTGRNGNGANSDSMWWCNPSGAKIGTRPVWIGDTNLDAQVWVKQPGESDGQCGIAPNTPASQFSPDLAIALIGDGNNGGDGGNGGGTTGSSFVSTLVPQHTSGQCVDIPYNNPFNGQYIEQWNCNGAAPQNFEFKPVAGESQTYLIKHATSNYCLDLPNGSDANDTPIQMYECWDKNVNQQWQLRSIPGKTLTFQVVAKSTLALGKNTLCLDIPGISINSGTHIHGYHCLPTNSSQGNQYFKISQFR
jgi:hypothetical protein